jgi:hypothetical protein
MVASVHAWPELEPTDFRPFGSVTFFILIFLSLTQAFIVWISFLTRIEHSALSYHMSLAAARAHIFQVSLFQPATSLPPVR